MEFVCNHGSIERKCEICERDGRIAELEAVLAYYCDPDEYLKRGARGDIEPRVLEDGGAFARKAVPHWEAIG